MGGDPAVLPRLHPRPAVGRAIAIHLPFAGAGHDVRSPLRGGASDEALRAQVASVWTRRADRYSELRSLATRPEQKVEMSHIGG